MGLLSSIFGRKPNGNKNKNNKTFQEPEVFLPDESEDVTDATMMIPRAGKNVSKPQPKSTAQPKTEAPSVEQPEDEIMDAISSAVQRKITKPAPSNADRKRISMELAAEQIKQEVPPVKQPAAEPQYTATIKETKPDVSNTVSAPKSEPEKAITADKPDIVDTVDDSTRVFKKPVEDTVDDSTRIFKPSELSGILHSTAAKTDEIKAEPKKEEKIELKKESITDKTVCVQPSEPVKIVEEEPEITVNNPAKAEPSEPAVSEAAKDIPSEIPENQEPVKNYNPASDFSSPVRIISSDMPKPAEPADPSVIPVWGTRMEDSNRYSVKPSMPSFDDECFRLTWKLKGTSKKHRLRVISECTKGQPVFIICDSNGENCIVITEDGEEIGRLSEQDTIVYHNMVAGTPHNMYIQKISSKEFQKISVKILVIVRKKETANI